MKQGEGGDTEQGHGQHGVQHRVHRRLRAEFARRRAMVRRETARHLPGPRPLGGGEVGLQTYVELPSTVDEDALVRAARARAVLLRGGRPHLFADPTRPPALALGYANVDCPVPAQAIARLGKACR
ncbi:hypothetical protein CFP65_5779 [Kitasatospora sp. MMS16-BH015]|uniref:hypothetical protein n=1 Tax=Kitasatospora sp. MMS16-BH015 TaxID=2018025 RepID=UPI000CA36F81|nr:hypothetical protein [Kitasatospora sp. MMS16-BH015]AUG80465.1 hypothetical protein CFP65_5779 [Kitasatospora sp. MMS16-BH015]